MIRALKPLIILFLLRGERAGLKYPKTKLEGTYAKEE
jgi:hypothetical protein